MQQEMQFRQAAMPLGYRPVEIKFRDYQTEAIRATLELWAGGTRRVLGVAGTGAGKTVIFFGVLTRWKFGRALIVVNTNMLARQALDRSAMFPELGRAEIFTGNALASDTRVVIATAHMLEVPAYARLVGKVDAMIVDECHAAVTTRYRRMMHHIERRSPEMRVLGVTATAIRPDGQSLGSAFDALAFHYPIDWLIENGWLVRPRGKVYAATSASTGEQVPVLGHPKAAAFIFGKWVRVGRTRQTIGFTSTVDEARDYAEYFQRQGVRAAYVHGRQSPTVQREVEADFRSGRLQVVFNAQIWTEGMDVPEASCVILARRFESQLLFIQAVGRVLRPAGGKTDALVLGFHPDGIHSLIQDGDILAHERPPMPVYQRAKFHQEIVPERQLGYVRPNMVQIAWETIVETAFDLLAGKTPEGEQFGILDALKRLFGR